MGLNHNHHLHTPTHSTTSLILLLFHSPLLLVSKVLPEVLNEIMVLVLQLLLSGKSVRAKWELRESSSGLLLSKESSIVAVRILVAVASCSVVIAIHSASCGRSCRRTCSSTVLAIISIGARVRRLLVRGAVGCSERQKIGNKLISVVVQ